MNRLGAVGSRPERPSITYVLRVYPELSETFIHREIRGLVAAGARVSVLAIQPGTSGAGGGTDGALSIPVTYLAAARGRAGDAARRRRRGGSLAVVLTRDLIELVGSPRRQARALRLGGWALRASLRLPDGINRLHAHFANDAGALARYIHVLRGVPYAVTAHAYDLFQDPFLLAPNLRHALRVYTVCRANVDFLERESTRLRLDPGQVELLRCGIDLDALVYRDPPPVATPHRLACVARLVPKKGHDVLLRAVARLVASGREIQLDLVGTGPQTSTLEGLVRRLDLVRSVRFHGAMRSEDVLGLLRTRDVAVLASRIAPDGDRDGLPVSLVEAMALGVPVVSTDVGGIPELIDAETGHLVPSDRDDLLAGAIARSLDGPQSERVHRARRARLKVDAEFDLRIQVKRLFEL